MLYRKKLQAPVALVALTLASACAVSDTTFISRTAQLDAALAAFPDTGCSYTVISPDVADRVMERPDGASVLASLSEACPGIRVGLQQEDVSFRTASNFGEDGLTETAGGGDSGGTGSGITGGDGGGTGGDGGSTGDDGGSTGGDGGSTGGDGGSTGGGDGGSTGGDGGSTGGDGGSTGGNNGGGKGGGSKGNNGGGNGSEGSSPGQGGGANNDE